MLMTISICHCMFLFFFYWYGDHRDLHVLTHSFPTRRSSDLGVLDVAERAPVGEDPVHHAGVDYACDGVVVEVLLVRRPFGVIGEPTVVGARSIATHEVAGVRTANARGLHPAVGGEVGRPEGEARPPR